ncbi:hypothetical protein [Streptomyces sp. NPDC058086]|uniref:hypothetical protein n=1 Tax=Streptomyces sp. NPDC058086 TaxID=3346334 RepID=UPI0036E3DB45
MSTDPAIPFDDPLWRRDFSEAVASRLGRRRFRRFLNTPSDLLRRARRRRVVFRATHVLLISAAVGLGCLGLGCLVLGRAELVIAAAALATLCGAGAAALGKTLHGR